MQERQYGLAPPGPACVRPCPCLCAPISPSSQLSACPPVRLSVSMIRRLGRHVILVGLPGSGKTTVGRLVAAALGTAFHDVDPIIEAEAGLTVHQIFADKGEDVFRSVEARTVTRLLAGPAAIIAPGGGWAAQPGNLDAAVTAGAFVIYLHSSPEDAARRTEGDSVRPLLVGGNRLALLRELLEARESYYRQSEATVLTDGRSVAEVAREVAELARAGAGPDSQSVR